MEASDQDLTNTNGNNNRHSSNDYIIPIKPGHNSNRIIDEEAALLYKTEDGNWTTGIFDCCPSPFLHECLLSCFLSTYQIARNRSAIQAQECGCKDCFYSTMCPFCCGILVRREIRDMYGINGSILSDSCAYFCCFPCAIAQDSREMKIRGAPPLLSKTEM